MREYTKQQIPGVDAATNIDGPAKLQKFLKTFAQRPWR